jgi:hypothetical protein
VRLGSSGCSYVPATTSREPNFMPAEIACRGTGKLLVKEAPLMDGSRSATPVWARAGHEPDFTQDRFPPLAGCDDQAPLRSRLCSRRQGEGRDPARRRIALVDFDR